ncbi:MAG: sulfite exporter TauE/SafE family protein [Nitrospirae bacterium]|nr:sulfite exporter TauE/SafE family protein [Nitrospirota bacterium]MCL5422673.1 sulfite exporter TauE/SafE family protein [Nitrospirota bacterium]
MDFLQCTFPVSGVKTNILIPPLVAMVISFFTSMGGVSGAFLLLPFQVSVLNYTGPSVSGTNFIFNIVAIPGGVYRYIKEGRMAWPLTWVVIIGTLPGVFIGYIIRVLYLPDPRAFKLFVGCVLLYVGSRLLYEFTGRATIKNASTKALENKFRERTEEIRKQQNSRIASGLPAEAVVKTISVSLKKIEYEFWGERFSYSTVGMFVLSFFVGIIGGTYGIGGAAIIVPFCVAVFHLPVYTIAGAALMGTFITSIAGVIFYSIIPVSGGTETSPDWLLGFLFGIGGTIGIYLGARFQKFVPQKFIKLIISGLIIFVALKYIVQYFV